MQFSFQRTWEVRVMPEAIIYGLSWVVFNGLLPQMITSPICTKLVHTLRLSVQFQNFLEIKPKNWFSDSFYEVFCLCPLTHYKLCPIFPKLKVLWIYTIVVSFISLAFAVVKLQIFKVLHINSAPMKCPLTSFF